MLNFEIKIDFKNISSLQNIHKKTFVFSSACRDSSLRLDADWYSFDNERCFQSCSAYGQHNQLIDSAFPSVNFKNSKLSMYIDSDWAK